MSLEVASQEWPVGVEHCFYCGDFMRGERGIFWRGSTGQVIFHPDCLVRFSTRMFSSLHDYQKLLKGGDVGGDNRQKTGSPSPWSTVLRGA